MAVRTWTEDGMHSTSFCNKNDQIEYIKSHFGQSPVMMILSYHNIIHNNIKYTVFGLRYLIQQLHARTSGYDKAEMLLESPGLIESCT